jgi:hypothetical protein
MTVISEADLGIVCESGKCTGTATYIVTVRTHETLHRLYCSECTAILVDGAAKLLRDNDAGPLHEHVETEYLLTGVSINA